MNFFETVFTILLSLWIYDGYFILSEIIHKKMSVTEEAEKIIEQIRKDIEKLKEAIKNDKK